MWSARSPWSMTTTCALSEKLTDIQHDFHKVILSTLHLHLDHDHCLEVLAVRGKSAAVRRLPIR